MAASMYSGSRSRTCAVITARAFVCVLAVALVLVALRVRFFLRAAVIDGSSSGDSGQYEGLLLRALTVSVLRKMPASA